MRVSKSGLLEDESGSLQGKKVLDKFWQMVYRGGGWGPELPLEAPGSNEATREMDSNRFVIVIPIGRDNNLFYFTLLCHKCRSKTGGCAI